jgi:SAM-dependent methyltransferase
VTLRAEAARLARRLRRRREQAWRPRTDPVRGRRHALREEVEYWEQWLANRGGRWADEYAQRFDAETVIADPSIREILTGSPQARVSILDVGAGPVSAVGYRLAGKSVSLTAVDPLADQYDRLLAEAGVVPPVRTERVDGEGLLAHFGPDRFDLAYSRNALDHAVDPVAIIRNMLGVVRSGGHVILRHVRNEALRQGYVQLHQWNFDEREGRPVIWRPDHHVDLTAALGAHADVQCHIEPADAGDDFEWAVWVITRR